MVDGLVCDGQNVSEKFMGRENCWITRDSHEDTSSQRIGFTARTSALANCKAYSGFASFS